MAANFTAARTTTTSAGEVDNFVEFILHGVITNAVAFVGFIGNLVCIVVLRRPQMRHNSTNVFLLALATFDAVLIVTSVLMKG